MQRFLSLIALVVTFSMGFVAPAMAAGEQSNPMDLKYDSAVWAIVVFVAILVILKFTAWGPILEGLQKREQSIAHALESAKRAEAMAAETKATCEREIAAAHGKIPALMEEARKDGERLKEEMRAEANAQIQAERQRLFRELAIAKDQALQDLWNQSAQLATLISAKAIGRSLGEDDHRRLVQEALQEISTKTSNN